MSDKPLRGALVGAGQVSQFHLQAWQQISEVEILAVVDPQLEKAHARANEFGIDLVYGDLRDLFQNIRDLDFLDITAPPEAHLELVSEAAEHKLHILCQKPFAASLTEARQMIDICMKAGVCLNVNENWRWRAWYRRIKTILNSGVIGKPVYASFFMHSSGWFPGIEFHKNHRFLHWPKVIMYDWGIHYVDIFRYLFSEIESVYSRMAGLSLELIGEDRALSVFNMDGLSAVLDISWSSLAPRGAPDRHTHIVEEFRIEGDLGTLELVPHPEKGDIIRITTSEKVLEEPAYLGTPHEAYKDSYRAAHQHFIDCLMNGTEPETLASDNLKTLAATLAAYESAETNQVISVRQFMEQ